MTIHHGSCNHQGKPSEMITGASNVPMRARGTGVPLKAGRADTRKRSAVKSADQRGRNNGPVKLVGEAEGGLRLLSRHSRIYENVTSKVRKFIETGFSEPRRVRSEPAVQQEFRSLVNRNRKYAHVTSSVSKLMMTGIREPRRIRSAPIVEQICEHFVNRNRRYAHIKPTIPEFTKTCLREPRRLTSKPSQETFPLMKPFKKTNKKYRHVKSRVAAYIRNSTTKSRNTELEKSEWLENTNPPVEFDQIESIIFANSEIQFRDVNCNRPTERSKFVAEMKLNYPFYWRLVNCRDRLDQFNLVLCIGLLYVTAWFTLFYFDISQ